MHRNRQRGIATGTRVGILAAVLGGMLPLGAAASQPIDPGAFRCQDFLVNQDRHQSWQQMVEVEHCDRIRRLARLAHHAPHDAAPQFFVERIPKAKFSGGMPVDIPLLRVVFPQRVFFDTAQSGLRPEALAVVRLVAESLRQDVPDVALFVAGHTDIRGSRSYNQALSVDRANAVAERVLDLDINLATVWRIGFGPDMPLVPNTGEEAWGYNRRVEFLFAGQPEAIAIWLADMQLDSLCATPSLAEATECRHSLALRSDYEALEVKSAAPRAIAPSSDAPHASAKASTAQAENPSTRGSAVAPAPARRIVINPINRTVDRVL